MATMYYPTPILISLIETHHLATTLATILPQQKEKLYQLIRSLYSVPQKKLSIDSLTEEKLITFGLLSKTPLQTIEKSSFSFLTALNFELTYHCNYSCNHCLQHQYRNTAKKELTAKQVLSIISQAKTLGFLKRGINLTGGEILGSREDIWEIIEGLKELHIPFRLNTNSWWALKKNSQIGNKTFKTAYDIVERLQKNGCQILALSFDARYAHTDITYATSLITTIELCEKAGLTYQIIFTGMTQEAIDTTVLKLKQLLGSSLPHLWVVTTDLVDIGAATNLANTMYAHQHNTASCNGKGFLRPHYLHINPFGEVRTCLFGINLKEPLSLHNTTLPQLLNSLFLYSYRNHFNSRSSFYNSFEQQITPYLHLYKPIIHECTKMIILSRYEQLKGSQKSKKEIHRQIALELSLTPLL